MKDSIETRFKDLLFEGQRLIEGLPNAQATNPYWIARDHSGDYQAWLTSTVNLLRTVSPPDGQFARECERLLADKSLANGIPVETVIRVNGLLRAAKVDWESGLLRTLEFVVAAQTLDSFLDHAKDFQEAGQKNEAAILASVVLEDTLKKIAVANGIATGKLTIDPIVDELTKKGVFNSVKAKRVKAMGGVRNKALHADWDDFDLRDVKSLIDGTRELVDKYLAESA